ncbi:MAG: hypothetical protein AAF890_10420 [Pseudomonadota bacterium]
MTKDTSPGWADAVLSVDFVLIVLGILAIAIPYYLYVLRQQRERLDSASDRQTVRDELIAMDGYARHRARLRKTSTRLQTFFGPKWSWKAYDRCLAIALCYPLLVFISTWLVTGDGRLGGENILPAELELSNRILIAALLIGQFGVTIFTFLRLDAIEAILKSGSTRLVRKMFPSSNSAADRFGAAAEFGAVAFAFAVAVAVAGAGAVAGAVAGAGAFAVAVAGAVAVAVAGAGAFAVAFAGAGAFAGAFTFAVAGILPAEAAVVWLTFFAALPVANAIADWGSWALTRWFIERAAKARQDPTNRTTIALDIVWDMIAACLCLILLAALLPLALLILNWGLIAFFDRSIDWQAYVTAAREDPLGQGLLVWLMLGTTLVPTIVHLALGLWAVLLFLCSGDREFAKQIEVGEADKPGTDSRMRRSNVASKMDHFARICVIK